MTGRRDWLRTAGAATVFKFVQGDSPLKAAQANSQIGFGFIGSGIRGSQLLDAFARMPGIRPLAVCDLYDGYLARARERVGASLDVTKDYQKVLARKDVDAVVIATPDHLHQKMTLEALDAGKHVYIEKPLTWRIEEGAAIISAEKRSGKVLQVGSGAKTSPYTAKMREIVKSGVLGKVNMVRCYEHRNDPQGAWVYPIPPDASEKTIDWPKFLGSAPPRNFDPKVFFRWRCWWEYSGGVATDLFVHLLSQLHEAMDVKGPKSAVSQGGIYRWKDGRSVPDVMNTVYEYDPEYVVDMYVNLGNTYTSRAMVIMGSEGTLVQSGFTGLTLYEEARRPNVQTYGSTAWPKAMRAAYFEQHGWTADGHPKTPIPGPAKPKEVTVESGPNHYELFVLSMRNGTPSKENATEGHFAAGAAHLANMAFQAGRRMRWDHATDKVTG
jgi:predicted dehydrogenase